MKKIKIIGAMLPFMWYAGSCGQTFDVFGENEDSFWVKEPSGKSDIVLKGDAVEFGG